MSRKKYGAIIGRPIGRKNTMRSPEEKEQMPELCKKVSQGVLDWIFVGAERAMNVLNTKNSKK